MDQGSTREGREHNGMHCRNCTSMLEAMCFKDSRAPCFNNAWKRDIGVDCLNIEQSTGYGNGFSGERNVGGLGALIESGIKKKKK